MIASGGERSFSRPAGGWLHSDNLINNEGITYAVKYVGCLKVHVSMKSLDFKTKSCVVKECINRVCKAAGFKYADKNKKVDCKVLEVIAGKPCMEHAEEMIDLTISSTTLSLTSLESDQIIAKHTTSLISFVFRDDTGIFDFVAYVANDTQEWSTCYVLECGGGLAKDVISTIEQAFELGLNKFLSKPTLSQQTKGLVLELFDIQKPFQDHKLWYIYKYGTTGEEELSEDLTEKEDEYITSQDTETEEEENQRSIKVLDKKYIKEKAKKLSIELAMYKLQAQRVLVQKNKQIKGLKSSNTTLRRKLNSLNAENKRLTLAISNHNKEMSELEAKLEQSKQQANDYKIDIDLLNEYCNKLEDEQTKQFLEPKNVKQKANESEINHYKEKTKRLRLELQIDLLKKERDFLLSLKDTYEKRFHIDADVSEISDAEMSDQEDEEDSTKNKIENKNTGKNRNKVRKNLQETQKPKIQKIKTQARKRSKKISSSEDDSENEDDGKPKKIKK